MFWQEPWEGASFGERENIFDSGVKWTDRTTLPSGRDLPFNLLAPRPTQPRRSTYGTEQGVSP